jgi:cytochrome c oxidase subunit 2
VRRHATGFLLALSVVAFAACGGSDGGSGGGAELSEAGARGQTISRSNGCSGCHGTSGQGGVGPAWVGLYGSQVELDDGTTVVADEEYLARSISDPGAEKVKDASVVMPSNGLSDEEIADVIAYIRDLSPNAGSGAGSTSGEPDTADTTVDE